MPIIKSAKKRVKVSEKATARNFKTKRNLRDALKEFAKALQGGKETEIVSAERKALSAIDHAAKKAVIHKNKAARKKSQVSAAAKAHGVKPAKAAAKKTPTKAKTTTKPAAKKPATKTTAKKAPAKKPATKKTSTKK
jgi:small subunit ribosomal protein S20